MVLFEGNPLCFKALVGEVQARACARVGVDTQEFVIGEQSCHFKLKTSNAVVNIDVYNCDSVHTLSQLPKTPAQPPARCLLFVDPFAHHVRMDDLAWFGKNSTHSAIIMYAAVQSAVRMAGSARSSSTRAETARGLEEQLRLYIGDKWRTIQTKQDSGGAHHGNNPRANTALICNELSRRLKCAATADTNTTSIRMAQQGATYGLVLATSSGKAFNNWKAVCRKDKRVQVISTPTGDMFEFQKDVAARHQSGSVIKAVVRFLHKAAEAAEGEWVQPGSLAKQILAHPVLAIKDVDNVLARVQSHAEGKLLCAPPFVHCSVQAAGKAPTVNKSWFRFFACTWSEVGDLGCWLACLSRLYLSILVHAWPDCRPCRAAQVSQELPERSTIVAGKIALQVLHHFAGSARLAHNTGAQHTAESPRGIHPLWARHRLLLVLAQGAGRHSPGARGDTRESRRGTRAVQGYRYSEDTLAQRRNRAR